MILGADPDQSDPEQRPGQQVERLGDPLRGQLLRALLRIRAEAAQIRLDERHPGLRLNHRPAHSQLVHVEVRPQRLMRFQQPVKGCPDAVGIQVAAQPQHPRQMVRGVLRRQAPEEPQALLSVGHDGRPVARQDRQCAGIQALLAHLFIHGTALRRGQRGKFGGDLPGQRVVHQCVSSVSIKAPMS